MRVRQNRDHSFGTKHLENGYSTNEDKPTGKPGISETRKCGKSEEFFGHSDFFGTVHFRFSIDQRTFAKINKEKYVSLGQLAASSLR